MVPRAGNEQDRAELQKFHHLRKTCITLQYRHVMKKEVEHSM
jgi:hypothetical protein